MASRHSTQMGSNSKPTKTSPQSRPQSQSRALARTRPSPQMATSRPGDCGTISNFRVCLELGFWSVANNLFAQRICGDDKIADGKEGYITIPDKRHQSPHMAL